MSTKIYERQTVLVALIELTAANQGAGNEVTAGLPTDAFVIDVTPVVGVPFNGTTPTVTLSDGTTTFVSAEVASAVAGTKLATDSTAKFYPSGGTLTASVGGTGSTVGRILIAVQYVRLGRSHEIQS